VEKSYDGPDGLPLGAQGRTLTLLSGGFDSAVAAWMIMRRGAQTDFLHFLMDCAQSEHAIAVAYELFDRWGHGSRSLMHVLNFQEVKEELRDNVDSRLRQVVLKQLMVSAADQVAENLGIPVIVTGESVGQVSSQTLEHLAAIDRFSTRTILRPLSGLTKREIIELSRRVGTHDLSARAKEVCDLSDGPVATSAGRRELDRAYGSLSAGLAKRALEQWRVLAVKDWGPGDPMVPVVRKPPEGVPLIQPAKDAVPESGPVALVGQRAPYVASELHRAGREVWVVDEAVAGTPV
jgi:thiamine biosynthesis protein ThiI